MNSQPPTPPDTTSDTPLETEPLRPTSAAVQTLTALTVFAAVATGFGLLTGILVLALKPDSDAVVRVLSLSGVLILGLLSCGVLVAGVAIIRRLERLSEQTAALEQHTAIQAQQSAAAPPPDRPDGDMEAIRRQLAELRETLLLPEDLRRRRFETLKEREFTTRLAAAEKLANSNDFHRAREQIQALVDRFGPDDRTRQMEAQIEQQAQAAQEMDFRHARDQIKDLMSLNQWDRAEQLSRELSEKYPQAKDPLALFQHVCRERQLFEQRHRIRLYEEIQQLANQRRWQEATQAAHQFITNFPTGPDTDALRARLDTLEANAEIQTRQQLEGDIKEHIRRREYWDALAVARRIIADYPFSPQANALRNQLPRLEELARSQKA